MFTLESLDSYKNWGKQILFHGLFEQENVNTIHGNLFIKNKLA